MTTSIEAALEAEPTPGYGQALDKENDMEQGYYSEIATPCE